MAKTGLFGGAPGGAGMTRPMPNPRLNPQMQAQAAPGGGGFFLPRGSQERYDMAQQMLELAMSSAAQSGSPLLAGLAPLAGVVIGGRLDKIKSDAEAAEAAKLTEMILGPGGLSPSAKEALAVLENENAPAYLRALAQKQFDAAMAGVVPNDMAQAVAGGGGRPGGGGGGGRSNSRAKSQGSPKPQISKALAAALGTGAIPFPLPQAGFPSLPYGYPVGALPTNPAVTAPAPVLPTPQLPADPLLPVNDPLGLRGP